MALHAWEKKLIVPLYKSPDYGTNGFGVTCSYSKKLPKDKMTFAFQKQIFLKNAFGMEVSIVKPHSTT